MEKKTRHYYDFSLLVLTMILVGFGLVMIFSSSSYIAQAKFDGDSLHFLKRQGLAVAIGSVLMLIISRLDYRLLIHKFKYLPVRAVTLIYIAALAMQILVLFIGEEYNGAKRWINLPRVGSFQPSELSKIALIVFTAYICYQAPAALNKFSGFVRCALYAAPFIYLIARENLSSAIIALSLFVAICFVTRRKLYYIPCAIAGAGALAAYIYFGEGYRMERIQIWLNLESNEKGYQILQGLYAIASGGLFGHGLGSSTQKLGVIPESYNDMIFTIICEELGILGAIAVIALFLMLLWRILIIAVNAPDLYGALICVGVLVQIAVQVALNIAVVTNTVPSTGIALPFISYGGTAVVLLLCEIGLVLSVSGHINYEN